jgi:integrase
LATQRGKNNRKRPAALTPTPKPTEPLTGSIVRKQEPPAEGSYIRYDGSGNEGFPGFGIRVTSNNVKSFVYNFRTNSGTERRLTIGRWPDWSVTDARREARRLSHIVDQGGDPQGDLESLREAPTVAKLLDRFEAEHLGRRRASTARDYRSAIAKYIRPHFRSKKVADVTFEHCDQLHHKITAAGHLRRANTVAAILSKAFSLAIRWGMRADNPCKGIDKNDEVRRKRYLKGDELQRLTAALAKHPDKRSADAFRMLLLTGARRGEVLSMRWADVDQETGTWSKPASSTKQKEDHIVPLSAPARQLLSEIGEQQSRGHKALGEFVFPGAGGTGHVVEIKRGWRQLCKAAGISGLRIHDLRHSFASQLASGGANLPLIGALLGHSNPTTTSRYAHLFDDPQRAATERVGAIIEAAANGDRPAAAVTVFGKRPGHHGR